MKKTLVALTVAALTATSASALTVFEENGSTIKVGGAVKLHMEKVKNGGKSKSVAMIKDDAKINVEAKYAFGDAYALGFYEYDFLGSKAKKAYVGLGNNAGHQVTFGLQNTFADNVGESSFDNIWGVRGKFTQGDADSTIAYRYTGLEGWEFGADYVLKQTGIFKIDGNDVAVEQKAWFDLGAKYSVDNFTAAFAISQQKNSVRDFTKLIGKNLLVKKTTALDTGFSYVMDNLTFALDLGYAKFDFGNDSAKAYYVSPGMKAAFGDAAVYGNYTYTKVEDFKIHGFNLGTEYQLVKNAKVFAEVKYEKVKDADKKADKAFGVGMKVEW
ncbi:porin [Pasteurella atlantica]|uniref:porin n=1 Tax=Pasteurellaceae TaxID=712 RepID=UPI00276F3DA6|nr:porin [Pasteurella atlantica]MDP8099936.1 porin [Pasteurella atlantica]MDP8107869.1 porin [Pasteurella atlantica]MDP8117618.1 porin [Pasteurella atlantica]